MCPSGVQLTDASGVITSPFYPRKYPSNQDCSWEIKGNRVKLVIDKMAIHRCGGDACTCDYLEVLDGFNAEGGAPSGKQCVDENFTPLTYYSTHEHLRVRFFSNPDARNNGFSATYTQLNYTPPGRNTAQ